jgi:hypothetical protein
MVEGMVYLIEGFPVIGLSAKEGNFHNLMFPKTTKALPALGDNLEGRKENKPTIVENQLGMSK